MQWVNVNNSSAGHYYELWDGENKLVSLSISTCTKITRIQIASDKRLFFIEKKGFLQNRTVIKNEYGIPMGEMQGATWEADKGSIELDGKKYAYTFNDTNEEPSLVIYEELSNKPLVSTRFSAEQDEVVALVKRSMSLHDTKYPSMLMALCWYLLKTNETAAKNVA